MITLGIETSCDETALALIETREIHGHTEYRIIQSLVHSQAKLHNAFGGVFPTLAKREHSKNLVPLLEKILSDLPAKNTETSNTNSSNDAQSHKTLNLSGSTKSFAEIVELFKKHYGDQNSDLLESFSHAHFLEKLHDNKTIPNIDRIAVTEGPGLEPALWVGITFARMLGELWGIPVIPVNHMEGHVVGSLISDDKPYGSWQRLKELTLPAVALLISGGHTELIKIESSTNNSPESPSENFADNSPNDLLDNSVGKFKYTLLGQTVDDAVGEAFDKTARLLGLPYPGGPHIAKLAHEAYEQNISSQTKLPRPMINSGDLNFSFSGLKTAVLYAVQNAEKQGILNKINTEQNNIDDKISNEKEKISNDFKIGLAYEFEQAVTEVLDAKLKKAIEEIGAESVIIGGGVSANHVLRKIFQQTADSYDIPLFLPSAHISGDNALMIALVGTLKSIPDKDINIIANGTKKITE